MQVSKVDKKNLNEPQVTNTFRIMLEVTNFFTSKITEENVDLIISVYEVYDSKELPKPLCENFVIENWKQSANPSEKTKQSVLFEGISKNDIKQLFLICNVVASGNFAKIKDAGKERPEVRYFSPFYIFVIGKDVSDLEMCMNYFAFQGRSCEKFN